jgi:peptide chain release factor 3
MRSIPIITFVNKLDRNGRDPLDILDEIERVLDIPCYPFNWPVGSGSLFQGVYDRVNRHMLRFERADGGSKPVPKEVVDVHDDSFRVTLGEGAHTRLLEELALLDGASCSWDQDQFLRGQLTPVFFASAMTNFGVEPFLDALVELAAPPRARRTDIGFLEPDAAAFNAVVFKIQANMDPHYRDRIAFIRICSGVYRRDMSVLHARTGKTLSLTKSFHFLAQERIQVGEAYSGDVIGLWDPGLLRIGDSLCEGQPLHFEGIPRFSPEHFVRVREADPMKRKQLKKGLEQLSEEGAVQLFFDRQRLGRDPVLGAVGTLQFDVTQYRLNGEYGASVKFERLPYQHARWIEGDVSLDRFDRPGYSTCVLDIEGRPLVLFENEWALRRSREEYPGVTFIAAVQPGRASRLA